MKRISSAWISTSKMHMSTIHQIVGHTEKEKGESVVGRRAFVYVHTQHPYKSISFNAGVPSSFDLGFRPALDFAVCSLRLISFVLCLFSNDIEFSTV